MTTKHLKFPAGTTDEVMTTAITEAGGLEPGSVVTLDVLHDDGCPRLDGEACCCDPEYQATVIPPKSAA